MIVERIDLAEPKLYLHEQQTVAAAANGYWNYIWHVLQSPTCIMENRIAACSPH